MKLQWLGHSCFLIESSEGVRVITDPYKAGAFGGALSLGKIHDRADVVTVSHEHDDHNAVGQVPGNPLIMRASGSAKGVDFHVLDVFHDTTQGSERGRNRIFQFAIDGIGIVHYGDLGHDLSASQTAHLRGWSADVLLIPVGGFYTIDAAAADRLSDALAPSIVIPMHVKHAKVNFPIAPVEEFLKRRKQVKRVGSSCVEITSDSLPATSETWVLEPAM
ncbi:MAG TPA: MBL fold metallo-hydrolase [bacterium]|nr:MBL fold metallo-hydrolase [bacterium]